MPRSSGRRSAPAARPRPVARAPPPPARSPPPPAPAPAPQAAPPQQQGGGMMSSAMGTLAQGMAFGAGSAVAHHAVGAAVNGLFGGKSQAEVTPQVVAAQPVASACEDSKSLLQTCLQNNDADKCSDYFHALQTCQENAKFA